MTGIYLITCLRSTKVYVGQSVNIEKRWLRHKEMLNANIHSNKHLQSAWNKYGENSFVFSILEECSVDKLTEREQYWIDFYGGINSTHNYNYQSASRNEISDETRLRMSVSHKLLCASPERRKQMSENTKRLRQDADWVARNSQAIRDSWTPERRQQMSIAKKGTKWTEKQRENRKKFDDSRRGVSRDQSVKNKISNTLKGHTVSEETRQKLREAGKRQVHLPVTEEQRKHISEGAKRGWETRRRNMQKKKSEEEITT